MNDSIAQTEHPAASLDTASWKGAVSTMSAVLLAILFLASGIWKLVDPFLWAERITQMQVPQILSLPAALAVGITETLAAILILIPRFRVWGAWIIGILLVAFMIYFAALYNVLRGEDCSCFPFLKRAVGPGFFIADGIMLLVAWFAGKWARPPSGLRGAAILLAAVSVFAFGSLGINAAKLSGVEAPASVTVSGEPYNLREGRVFLYFFNPECSHCDEVARSLSKLDWEGTRVVSASTDLHRFGPSFMQDTGMPGVLTEDIELLRKHFQFSDPPFAVALQDGRPVEVFRGMDGDEPLRRLRETGFAR
jgi:uncharacterized membrane protein/thiol-disulfide isomerase/thioredoxin